MASKSDCDVVIDEVQLRLSKWLNHFPAKFRRLAKGRRRYSSEGCPPINPFRASVSEINLSAGDFDGYLPPASPTWDSVLRRRDQKSAKNDDRVIQSSGAPQLKSPSAYPATKNIPVAIKNLQDNTYNLRTTESLQASNAGSDEQGSSFRKKTTEDSCTCQSKHKSRFVETTLQGVENWLRDHEWAGYETGADHRLTPEEMGSLSANLDQSECSGKNRSNIEAFLSCALVLYRYGYKNSPQLQNSIRLDSPADIEHYFSKTLEQLQKADTPIRRELLQGLSGGRKTTAKENLQNGSEEGYSVVQQLQSPQEPDGKEIYPKIVESLKFPSTAASGVPKEPKADVSKGGSMPGQSAKKNKTGWTIIREPKKSGNSTQSQNKGPGSETNDRNQMHIQSFSTITSAGTISGARSTKEIDSGDARQKQTLFRDLHEMSASKMRENEAPARDVHMTSSTFSESHEISGNPTERRDDDSAESSAMEVLNDYYEEMSGTLSSVMLYLIYLAVAHGRASNILCDSSEDSKSTSGSHQSNRTEASSSLGDHIGSHAGKSGSQSANLRKHSRADGNDEDDSVPPPRKPRYQNKSNNLPFVQFACPYGKASPLLYPKCILKNRRDLSGVKEHLKRNHFEGTLPETIKATRTWDSLFQVCNPYWPTGVKIPSPHFDPYEIYISSRQVLNAPASKVSYMPITASHSSRKDDLNTSPTFGKNQQQYPPSTVPGAYASDPSAREQPLTEETIAFKPSQGEAIHSLPGAGAETRIGSAYTCTEQEILESGLSDFLSAFLIGVDSSPTPKKVEEIFRDVISSIDYNLDSGSKDHGSLNIVPSSLTLPFEHENFDFSPWISSSNTSVSVIEPVKSGPTAPSNSFFDKEILELSALAPSPNPTSRIFRGIVEETNSCRQRIQCREQQILQKTQKKYLLCITRNPALSKSISSETPGVKRFSFDDMDEFGANFDTWMKTQFNDPGFCWRFWEIENPLTKEKLESTEAVISTLEFTWLAFRSNQAAFWLVPKQMDL